MIRPSQPRRALPALLAAVLVVSVVAPAGALAATGATTASPVAQTTAATTNATATATTATPSNESDDDESDDGDAESDDGVSAGHQLSTVLSVTSDEVQTEVENAGFESVFETSDDDERAEAIAERASELRERSAEIREAHREASEAYREGELTRTEYAQRLAVLNARAEHVTASYARLATRAETVSSLELRAAGVNATELRSAGDGLDSVRGTGAAALRQRFTGERNGTFAVNATEDGVSIEVEDDGRVAREIDRSRDDDRSMTVSQSEALSTARDELPAVPDGNWTLVSSNVDAERGYYEFVFMLRNAGSGVAEVRVDGSSGDVFRLRTAYQRGGDSGDADDEFDDFGEFDDLDDLDDFGESDRFEGVGDLVLLVRGGNVAPGEELTLQVRNVRGPVEGARVTMNDELVGTTGADGTVTVTLPESGEVEFEAERGDADADLEFDLGGREEAERRQFARQLQASASVVDGDVSVRVRFNGSAVSGATAYVDGESVGTTDANGEVTFTADAGEDFDVRIVKGSFSATISFEAENGVLRMESVSVDDDADDDDADDESETDDADDDDADDESETDDADDDDADDADDDADDDDTDDDADDADDENETDDETTTDQP